MAVGSGHVVLGLAQLQVASEGTWAAVEVHLHDVSDGSRREVALLSTVRLNKEGKRLGDADGVGELHARALGKASLHDGLGHPAASIGGRAVDLGRILARESAATMGAPAAVGVNDDLAAGEASVTLRAANDELARRVNVEVARLTIVDGESGIAVLQLDGVERSDNNLFVDQLVHLLHGRGKHLRASVLATEVGARLLDGALSLKGFGVLRRDDNGVDAEGLDRAISVLLVLDGDLGLAIRTEPPQSAVLADICERLAELGGHQMGQRHCALGLVRSVAEHDALVTRTDVEVGLADVHATSDVGRLLVDADEHLARVARKALGVDR
mmetsp:Transcript_18826/g.56867  ORF Transcript_18826/g.56867 Transcript_18826/m.56867 type:complete len:327 (+) Transcript_18826:548-1528(+)|eukprot:scaffold306494_cov28-Tisochrysis_lutea.AAC.2